MGSNSGRVLAAVLLLCLVSAVPLAAAAITCDQVVSAVSQCAAYISGAGLLPTPCCGALRSLTAAAKTTPDRQAACNCLKKLSGSVPGMKPALAAGLPGKCGVVTPFPFPIGTTTDCTKVH